jgi:hypothetical protein
MVTGVESSRVERKVIIRNATHLEHLLGAGIDDALASLLHPIHKTHDDVLLDSSSFWNDIYK